jgi:ACR3 family arsenite efflux pump ArsB
MTEEIGKRFSFLFRFLALWIFAAMAFGDGVGYFVPGTGGPIDSFQVGLIKLRNRQWYEQVFFPKISPLTLTFPLFTVVVMFSLKGNYMVRLPIIICSKITDLPEES